MDNNSYQKRKSDNKKSGAKKSGASNGKLAAARKRNRKKEMWANISTVFIIALFVVVGLSVFTGKKGCRMDGIKAYEQSDYEEAIKYFDEALDKRQLFDNRVDVDLLFYKADCYMKLMDYANAKSTLVQLKSDYSARYYDKNKVDNLIALCDYVEKYNEGKYGVCAGEFANAAIGGYPELALYAAICYENLEEFDKMKENLDLYASKFGCDAFVSLKYASYYIFMEDYNNALVYANQGVNAGTGDTECLKRLQYIQIMCYIKSTNYSSAYTLATGYVQAYPDDEEGLRILKFLDSRINVDEEVINDIFNTNGQINNESENYDGSIDISN